MVVVIIYWKLACARPCERLWGHKDEWMEGQMEGWMMDGWVDGRMDGRRKGKGREGKERSKEGEMNHVNWYLLNSWKIQEPSGANRQVNAKKEVFWRPIGRSCHLFLECRSGSRLASKRWIWKGAMTLLIFLHPPLPHRLINSSLRTEISSDPLLAGTGPDRRGST